MKNVNAVVHSERIIETLYAVGVVSEGGLLTGLFKDCSGQEDGAGCVRCNQGLQTVYIARVSGALFFVRRLTC